VSDAEKLRLPIASWKVLTFTTILRLRACFKAIFLKEFVTLFFIQTGVRRRTQIAEERAPLRRRCGLVLDPSDIPKVQEAVAGGEQKSLFGSIECDGNPSDRWDRDWPLSVGRTQRNRVAAE